jgi:DNA polymerase
VYKDMAGKIYQKSTQSIVKEERAVGKETILGAGYGMGKDKFATVLRGRGLREAAEQSGRIIAVYRTFNDKVVEFWYHCQEVIQCLILGTPARVGKTGVVWAVDGAIELPNGLKIHYPNLRMHTADGKTEAIYDSRKGVVRLYGPKLVENICQAVARCIIAEQLVQINKRYRVVLTVHDAVATIAPTDERESAVQYIESVMRTAPKWAKGLPLSCESGYGDSYGDC